MTQREIDRGRNLLADGGMPFDLLANRFHGGVRTQEPIGQRFVFTKQAQQQMLRFDIRTAELAGFVSGKEDNSARLLRVSLKHKT